MTDQPRGKIIIISSPSGGGKTSICQALLSDERKAKGWTFSISYTTRRPRGDEQTGREYHFVDDQQFEKMVANKLFAEHFNVHLYQYGTPRQPLEKVLNEGGVMILDVDKVFSARDAEIMKQTVSDDLVETEVETESKD